jgi:hypothetical protein
MVMMKLMKALTHSMTVEDKPVHQIFQERPGGDACQDQMEAIPAWSTKIAMASGTVTKSPKCLARRITPADRLVMMAARLIGSPRRRYLRLFPRMIIRK